MNDSIGDFRPYVETPGFHKPVKATYLTSQIGASNGEAQRMFIIWHKHTCRKRKSRTSTHLPCINIYFH
jgi:hypothetical protein